jgi:hypothetical protein
VTLATTNLAAGSTVDYTISGTGITGADFAGGLLTGTFTVDASGTAVVPLGLLADATTEASETLTIALANGKASADVVVNDTSLTPAVQPTYSLTTDRTNVDEGGTVNVTLATTNLAAGSTVDYTISGTGISGADFAGGLLTGTFTIDAAGQAVVPLGLLADATTEGPETLTIALANGKASADVVVNDTSVTPPTYALTTDKANADEGGIVNVTLATTNLVAGSTVDYTISGAGISAADVAGGLLTGTFTVDASGQAVVPLGLLADATTEGSETLTITLANGKASADVVVNDTSLTPTYALTTDKAKVDEGGIVNVTLATTNLVAGSTVDYTISGAGITPADVAGGLLTGTFKVDASGQAVVPLGLLADATTEGPETLTIALANGKASADVVVNDTSVTTINVTSANAAKPSDVSSGDFDVDLAAGNYATEITGFAAGDKIGLPTAFLSTATVINNDGADGVITITGDDGNGNVLTVNLTGVAPGADAKVYGVGSFNNAFGAGSLFDDTPPPPPTFALKTDVANVDEGKTVNVTLQTTNVATGTTFDYRISGTGITAADFVGGALTGTFTVDASGKAVVPLALAADGAVEGAETLSIALVNGKASAQVLINDASVTPPVDPGPTTLNVTSANAAIPNDVSAGDFTVDLAAGNYATQVIGFAAGDKIGLPTAFLSTATVTNTDGTDGNITISGDNGNGNVLTVNLTGVAPGADAKVYGVGSFNNTFGAGSLFDDTPATPPVNPSPSTVNITAANAGVVTDMSAGNVTAVLAAGNYDTELSGFVAGDKIDLPAAFLATAALTNTDATDGMFTIAGDDGNGNVLTVNLSGVALTADAKVWSITTFNNTFGAGSLY